MDYSTFPAFAGLSSEQVERIVRQGKRLEFAAGEEIVSAGTVGTHVHFLLAGGVRVSAPGSAGNLQELAMAVAPCVVGEMELFIGGPHLATVAAVQTCATLSLAYDVVRKALIAEDAGMLKVMFNVSRLIAQRLHDMDEKVIRLLQQRGVIGEGLEGLRNSLFSPLPPAAILSP